MKKSTQRLALAFGVAAILFFPLFYKECENENTYRDPSKPPHIRKVRMTERPEYLKQEGEMER